MFACMKIIRKRLWVVGLVLIAGCGPQVGSEELGTIEYEVPKFDPDDQKYPLPQLGVPETENSAPGSSTHSHKPGNERPHTPVGD
jgi:hypothetical protein